MLGQQLKSFALILISLCLATLVVSAPQGAERTPEEKTLADILESDIAIGTTDAVKPIGEPVEEGNLLVARAGREASQFQVKINNNRYNLAVPRQVSGFSLPSTNVRSAEIVSGPAGIGCYLKTNAEYGFSDIFFSPASATFGLISMRTFQYTGRLDGATLMYCYKVQTAAEAAHTVAIAMDYIHRTTGQTTHTTLLVEMERYSALRSLWWTFTSRGARLSIGPSVSILTARVIHNPYRGLICLFSSGRNFRDISPGVDLYSPIEGVDDVNCMTRDLVNDMKDMIGSLNPNRYPWARGWEENPIFKFILKKIGG